MGHAMFACLEYYTTHDLVHINTFRNKYRNYFETIQFNSLLDFQIHSSASYTIHQRNNTMIFEERYSGHAHWTTVMNRPGKKVKNQCPEQ